MHAPLQFIYSFQYESKQDPLLKYSPKEVTMATIYFSTQETNMLANVPVVAKKCMSWSDGPDLSHLLRFEVFQNIDYFFVCGINAKRKMSSFPE